MQFFLFFTGTVFFQDLNIMEIKINSLQWTEVTCKISINSAQWSGSRSAWIQIFGDSLDADPHATVFSKEGCFLQAAGQEGEEGGQRGRLHNKRMVNGLLGEVLLWMRWVSDLRARSIQPNSKQVRQQCRTRAGKYSSVLCVLQLCAVEQVENI